MDFVRIASILRRGQEIEGHPNIEQLKCDILDGNVIDPRHDAELISFNPSGKGIFGPQILGAETISQLVSILFPRCTTLEPKKLYIVLREHNRQYEKRSAQNLNPTGDWNTQNIHEVSNKRFTVKRVLDPKNTGSTSDDALGVRDQYNKSSTAPDIENFERLGQRDEDFGMPDQGYDCHGVSLAKGDIVRDPADRYWIVKRMAPLRVLTLLEGPGDPQMLNFEPEKISRVFILCIPSNPTGKEDWWGPPKVFWSGPIPEGGSIGWGIEKVNPQPNASR